MVQVRNAPLRIRPRAMAVDVRTPSDGRHIPDEYGCAVVGAFWLGNLDSEEFVTSSCMHRHRVRIKMRTHELREP